jgi:hypothetical protein
MPPASSPPTRPAADLVRGDGEEPSRIVGRRSS